MGQTYNVHLKCITDKGDEIISAVKDYMKQAVSNERARFNETYEPVCIDNIARIFLAAHQSNFEKEDSVFDSGTYTGIYSSYFNATYGWDMILEEFWNTIKKYLDQGSYITVSSDSDFWTETVQNRRNK